MESAFPEAAITGYEFLTNTFDANDSSKSTRLGFRGPGRVDAIITLNTRDFPQESLSQFGIERLTPDQFTYRFSRMVPKFVALVRAAEESKMDDPGRSSSFSG